MQPNRDPEGVYQRYPDRPDPTTETDAAPDKQSELKLNAGIAVLASGLCFFVAVVFGVVFGSWVGAVAFGIIGVICLVVLARAVQRRHRARGPRGRQGR